MNTEKLARATFVLERETAEELRYVADRMGVSRSALAREVLTEPVAMMARWMRSVPRDASPEDLERLTGTMTRDMGSLMGRNAGVDRG